MDVDAEDEAEDEVPDKQDSHQDSPRARMLGKTHKVKAKDKARPKVSRDRGIMSLYLLSVRRSWPQGIRVPQSRKWQR